MKRKLKNVRNS